MKHHGHPNVHPVLRRLLVKAYAAIRLRPLSRLARAVRKGLRIDWA